MSSNLLYDREIFLQVGGKKLKLDIYSEEGFDALAQLFTRSTWEKRTPVRNNKWLGVPIVQLPEDLLMMQEVIYEVKPDVILDIGTGYGGSAVFYASILELLGKGRVISIDINHRRLNQVETPLPMQNCITLVLGNSIDKRTVAQVQGMIGPKEKVLVALDANHSYSHVSEELRKYAPLVTLGSYIVVFDGFHEIVYDAPKGNPKWKMDNAARAAREFLAEHSEFEENPDCYRLGVTFCTNGFLRRKNV